MNAKRLTLESVCRGPTINSHGRLTDEYTLNFTEGVSGRGSAPVGETLSRYEMQRHASGPDDVIAKLASDRIVGASLSQQEFDDYLSGQAALFGAGAVFSLSCAFFEAARLRLEQPQRTVPARLPRLSLNVLNGHRHAYTNPVLSDFHEFLLVPEHRDLPRLLEDHLAIQEQVRARLAACKTTRVNNNEVHILGDRGNLDAIELLLGIVDSLGLSGRYGLMIDAAAGQLWNGEAYNLDLAERDQFSPAALADYWAGILQEYPVAFLEDPFAEHDLENWRGLVTKAGGSRVTGDDVHCGDARRIHQLLENRCMNAVILKPDQAGTITATLAAVEAARAFDAPVILSHRSIGTDSLLLAHLAVHCEIELAKFGPLLTDFTAILKINEILRMSRDGVPVEAPRTANGDRNVSC